LLIRTSRRLTPPTVAAAVLALTPPGLRMLNELRQAA
jgi:hypothetical protein